MKRRQLFIAAVLLFSLFPVTGWAIENSAGMSSVERGVVPQSSSNGSGLFRSPNPIDTSYNLMVTGNVGGGKHFRGSVPYRSTSDFWADTGSSSLDSFLRRSSGSGDFGRYTGRDEPYHSYSRTVTTTRPGYTGVIKPPTAKISSSATDVFAVSALPKKQVLPGRDTATSYNRFKMAETSQLVSEKLLLSESEKYSLERQLTQEQMEIFQQYLKEASERADKLEERLTEQDDSSQLLTKDKTTEDIEQDTQQQEGEDKQLDIYEQMKKDSENFQKTLEELLGEEQSQEDSDVDKKAVEEDSQKKDSASGADTGAGLSARARAIWGSHKTFASYSEDKFNQHIKAAEGYLKKGKYYRAANAYRLALLYKPNDPLAYAGRCHALFAAGEYMSSALFLSRALEIYPEYAQLKIDIVAVVGDRDRVESRIVDIEQWVKKNDVSELRFLLAYIYYRLGRLEPASEAIEAAYAKMPDSPAVVTLKKAIDEAIKSTQR